jgi:hypothetical protein
LTIDGTRKMATETGRHRLYEKITSEWAMNMLTSS